MRIGAPIDALTPAPVAPAILVVDDDEAKRLALCAMLAPLGHTVVEAGSGHAALRAISGETFAMILMDVRMPTLDGYETAQLIRQRESELTPIIFVTAFAGDEIEVDSAYASGAVDFVSTPIRANVLRAKVSTFVELFVQSQERRRTLESITLLNTALRDSERRTHAVLDNVSDGIFILDGGGLIESVNRSVGQLFGYHAGEPIGHPFVFMIAPERRDEFRGLDAAHAGLPTRNGTPGRAIETLGCRLDGSTFVMELDRAEMRHGDRSFTLVCVRDISERTASTNALERQALYDDLTGLASRTLFCDHMSRTLVSAKRASKPRAVLMMDLDGFQQVNDRLGHDLGDTLLRQVGERLAALPDIETLARLSGDAFGILPAGACDLTSAAGVAWKIQQACEPEFVIDGEVVDVSASIGIALFPEHGSTTAELLRCAEMAMYVAKQSGNAHAVFEVAKEEKTAHHLALLLDLRECVIRDELILHYQPQVDLVTREIYGFEALIRWQHPTQGLLWPDSFMSEVERTDLIVPLTRWVLDAALRQQRAWREEGFDLTMAVNVSTRSLRDANSLPDAVAEATQRWETAPGRLTLELTEGALIGEAAPAVLAHLHAMGALLSIDDFGTGYSSLAYLRRLPVNEIKIDRSFILELAAGGEDAIIVRSTIDLAHNLGLTVVAEGVEDENVAKALAGYGCDGAQGYHFGRPAAAEDLHDLLSNSVPRGPRAVIYDPKCVDPPGPGSIAVLRSAGAARGSLPPRRCVAP
jgi:diguanylate cyclase (GGDEF)-like protein/PAS domain S-box-containing protein